MWACPNCGNGFKRMNQGHYCDKSPENIEEYFKLQPVGAQAHLNELRQIILSTVPGARETHHPLEMQTCIKNFEVCTAQITQHEVDHCNGVLI